MTDPLELAVDIAREAGALQRARFRGPRQVQTKSTPIDLVTDVDHACDALIARRLGEARPDDALLTEEENSRDGRSDWRWIVDPLDGTVNYAHGVPHFAVSIGAELGGERVLGVVYAPLQDELFTAARGEGGRLNGTPLAVSDVATLEGALLATGFAYDVHRGTSPNLEYFGRFLSCAQAVRRPGSAALDLAYVAAGRFDGFWELSLHAWDVAAGLLLVTEAGGRVSDLAGGPVPEAHDRIVASNGALHDPMLEVLSPRSKSPARAGE